MVPPVRWRFTPRVFDVPGDPTVEALIAALAPRPGLCVLDSAGGTPCRASVVAFDPLATLRIDSVRPDWIDALRGFAAQLAPADAGDPVPGPFHGGVLAALGYDLGAAGERPVRVAPEPWRLPLAFAGLYVDFFVRDEPRGRTWLVLDASPRDGRASVAERCAALLERIARPPEASAAIRPRGPLERHVSSAAHRARIERLREAIGRGDLYQANLAHRFTRAVAGSPQALYRRLRAVNAAPYMAYLESCERAPDGAALWAIASASPELLVETDGRVARTRPIKGTIARGSDEQADSDARAALLASDKDRAELTMIVDLERNDLGRIARPGGVWVEGFPTVQTYPGLHHLVADVVAELLPECDAWDVVASLFPGGSISGAPKLAAMDAIAALEQEGRGFFTGSIGFVDTRGHACFNILIRTLLWRATDPGLGEVSFRVGGGITWSSDALAEERETLVKAERLIAASTGAAEPESAAAGTAFGGAAVGERDRS